MNKNNEKLKFCDFFVLKSINFSHILCDKKKSNMVTPQFFCPLERVCLTLQNTINLEKWQDFNFKKFQLFSLKFHGFPSPHLKQYIIDRMT